MITRTTDQVPNKKIVATYGLVRGKGIRARHIGTDIMAGLKGIVGGEIHEYTKLMGEVREQSIDRMIAEAKRIGANPIRGNPPHHLNGHGRSRGTRCLRNRGQSGRRRREISVSPSRNRHYAGTASFANCRLTISGSSCSELNFIDTTFETPFSSMVTPYIAVAAWIVRLL